MLRSFNVVLTRSHASLLGEIVPTITTCFGSRQKLSISRKLPIAMKSLTSNLQACSGSPSHNTSFNVVCQCICNEAAKYSRAAQHLAEPQSCTYIFEDMMPTCASTPLLAIPWAHEREVSNIYQQYSHRYPSPPNINARSTDDGKS